MNDQPIRPSSPSDVGYTVKDMARAIATDASDDAVRRAMRQVRHWTNNDLLTPRDGKDTGTGKSRVYDELEVYKAGIIQELSRYGVTVDMIDTIGGWLDIVSELDGWHQTVQGTADVSGHSSASFPAWAGPVRI